MIEQKAALTGTMLGSMVIFNDPTYILIASIGAFVSAASAYADKDNNKISKILIGFISGFIVSLLSFMLLIHAGDNLLNKYMDIDTSMLPSFWFVVTIIIATESTSILRAIQSKIRKLSGSNE